MKTLITTLRLGNGVLSEQHLQGLQQLELYKVAETAIQEITQLILIDAILMEECFLKIKNVKYAW